MSEKNLSDRYGFAGKAKEAFMATLRDAAYGAAAGKALNVPYEFMERGLFHAAGDDCPRHKRPAGRNYD